MTGGRTRLSLVEYGAPKDLCKAISDAIDVDRVQASHMLLTAGARAAKNLGIKDNLINIDSTGVRAFNVAGLIRLGPSLELEIAPKFLGLDDADARWREDFFFLSTLSRHGSLLASEQMAASGGAPRDLSTLIARAIITMYQAHKGRPLRAYRRAKETNFFLDGDPDPIDLIFPGPDGFEQEITRYDRQNTWNSIISAAAKSLLPEISDVAAAGSLIRMIEELTPQGSTGKLPPRKLPARHKAWQPLYDLSLDVLNGLGLTYKQGLAHAPGYVVSTWQIWEDLITISSRIAFGRSAVLSQTGFILGSRKKINLNTKSTSLSVVPDCVIAANSSCPRFVLDAKYKGHIERGSLRIAEADVYEAMAFGKATGCQQVVLVYPAAPDRLVQLPGSCMVFERIDLGTVLITGVQVEARDISKTGALSKFAVNFADGIKDALLA